MVVSDYSTAGAGNGFDGTSAKTSKVDLLLTKPIEFRATTFTFIFLPV